MKMLRILSQHCEYMQEMVYSGFKHHYAFHSTKVYCDAARADEDTAKNFYATENFIDDWRSYTPNEILSFHESSPC